MASKRWIVRVDTGPDTRATVTKHTSQRAAYVAVIAANEQRKAGAPIEEIEVYVDEGNGPQLYEQFPDKCGWF